MASVAAAWLSAAEVEVVIAPRRLVVSSRGRRRRRGGEETERKKAGEETEPTTATATPTAEAKPATETPANTVFLDIALEKMVVPDESTWTLLEPGGEGEEGLLVTLTKANVELFASCCGEGGRAAAAAPSPSLTWWPRLAKKGSKNGSDPDDDETAVAWDDYENDYSDLPGFAAEKINAAEAAARLERKRQRKWQQQRRRPLLIKRLVGQLRQAAAALARVRRRLPEAAPRGEAAGDAVRGDLKRRGGRKEEERRGGEREREALNFFLLLFKD